MPRDWRKARLRQYAQPIASCSASLLAGGMQGRITVDDRKVEREERDNRFREGKDEWPLEGIDVERAASG